MPRLRSALMLALVLAAAGCAAPMATSQAGVHAPDAVPDEAGIVRRQGLEFVNIPIRFGNPTDADFQAFVEVMSRLRDRKVRRPVLTRRSPRS